MEGTGVVKRIGTTGRRSADCVLQTEHDGWPMSDSDYGECDYADCSCMMARRRRKAAETMTIIMA